MNAIQNSIKTSEKVSPVSCYCKLSSLVAHLRELSNRKLKVHISPVSESAPYQRAGNAQPAVIMYVNR